MRNIRLLCLAFTVAVFAGAAQGETIFHYSFDTDYSDSSGNGFDGTPTDGSGDSDTDGVGITNTSGEYVFGGGAANFTAERDFVSVPKQLIGSGNEYTVAFWGRDLSDSSSGGMALGQIGGSHPDWFFLWHWNTYFRWRGSGREDAREADFEITRDNEWHHWVVVAGDHDLDGSKDDITLYRDGALVGSEGDNLTGFIIDTIGDGYNANFDWEGQIDEVWMFDTALSDAQVRSLHSTNVIPEPTSVLLLLCGLLSLAGLRAARR